LNNFVGTPPMLQYVRLNSCYQNLKNISSRMLTSTYMIASDPNSMRDQGKSRNAEYQFEMLSKTKHKKTRKNSSFLE